MDPKDPKSPDPKVNQREVSGDADSFVAPPRPRTNSPGKANVERPGESLMNSDDPQTAALRAWAKDKQLQVPGTDGSFVLGQMSMGAGAVSGGPMFLPRKEFIVDPPHHSTDHGPVNVVKREGEEEQEGTKKKRSFSNLFKKNRKESSAGLGDEKNNSSSEVK